MFTMPAWPTIVLEANLEGRCSGPAKGAALCRLMWACNRERLGRFDYLNKGGGANKFALGVGSAIYRAIRLLISTNFLHGTLSGMMPSILLSALNDDIDRQTLELLPSARV